MPGTRNGVHNPGEFFLLTRAFVILESLVSELAPQHNYMESFHEEISRLTAKHFSLTRIKQKTTKLARDLERSDVSPKAIWAGFRVWKPWEAD
jgi:ubiquinone biosynthesis protein